jgi:serine/threonine-protein kinase
MTVLPTQIGRYQILRRLGGGGMGSVFLARDPDLDRLLAIKLIKEDVCDNPELRERFQREARSAARLRHPNIVTIFDIGEHDGRPFIAMEHIGGESLADVIGRRDPMPVGRKLKLVEMLCAGLHHAHRAGIVHRDTKPANLMIDLDGTLKIVDFGIARLGDSSMTREGSWVGSINYMSPEQVRGHTVDHRSDVFAVGAVAYELFTYAQAFSGGMSDGVFGRIVEASPSPMAMLCPGIDQGIVEIVERALTKDPAARYQDLSLMARDCSMVRERIGPEDQGLQTLSGQTSVATALPGTPLPAAFTPRPTPISTRGRSPGTATPRSTPASQGRSPEADRLRRAELHLDAAHLALDRKEYDKAQTLAEQAAALNPTSAAIAALLAEVRTAADAARAGAQRRGELEAALSGARSCLDEGDHAGARQHFDRASALAPDDRRLVGFGIRLRRAEADAAARRDQRPTQPAYVEPRRGASGSRTTLLLIAVIVLGAIAAYLLLL